MNLLETMIRKLETMASSNPNRPIADYWFEMRADGSYRKAMCALEVFKDRASFEDEARAELTGATHAHTCANTDCNARDSAKWIWKGGQWFCCETCSRRDEPTGSVVMTVG